jgi:hypothetical protein
LDLWNVTHILSSQKFSTRRMSLPGSAQFFIHYLGDSHPHFMLHIHPKPVFVLSRRNFWNHFKQDVTKGITNFHTFSINFLHSACIQIQKEALWENLLFREHSRQKPSHSLLSKCLVHGKHENVILFTLMRKVSPSPYLLSCDGQVYYVPIT